MSTERDVWQDVQRTDEGLSVTTYSQAADGEPVVEAEAYWTWDELGVMLRDAGQIAIPQQAARVALRELNILVTQTGGAAHATGPGDHTSPLARVRMGLEALENVDERTRREALQVLYNVAADRGVELSDVDPLQGDVFNAEQALAKRLPGGDD